MTNEVVVRTPHTRRAGIRAKAKSLKARETREIDVDSSTIAYCSAIA